MSAVLDLFATAGAPYWVLFAVLFLSGVGLPLPEDVPLIASGILCAQGDMDVFAAFAVSMVGVLGGDTIVYTAGRRLGVKALRHPALVKRLGAKRLRRMRALYRLRGERVVFFARFLMGVRLVAFFLAGAVGIRYRRFVLLDGLAALLSVPAWIALGYWLGTRYGRDIDRALAATEDVRTGIGIVFIVVAVVVVVRWVRLLRQVRATVPKPGATPIATASSEDPKAEPKTEPAAPVP